jgi:hypothetical protein
VLASVLLAFVPEAPRRPTRPRRSSLASGGVRVTGSTNRRLRVFAVTQVAASFVLLAGAAVLLKTLLALQAAPVGFETRNVLALNVPTISNGRTPAQNVAFYKEAMRRIVELPGVNRVAVGTVVPWRDANSFGPGFEFWADGLDRAPGQENPHAQFRTVSPGFFAALGVPLVSGRDFDDNDRRDGELVVIVSRTLAERLFPGREALNRHLVWTDPVMKFIDVSTKPRRIVGIAPDIDDEHVVPGPMLTVYHPFEQQELWGGRLFVHARTDPYALVPPVTRIVRELSVDQPIERAATLTDVRTEVLTPVSAEHDRLRWLRVRRRGDRRRRRGGRARVLGQRAHARVRHPPGGRLAAARPAGRRGPGRRRHGRGGCGGRSAGRSRAGASRAELPQRPADARSASGPRGVARAARRGGGRLGAPRRPRGPRRRHAGAALGVTGTPRRCTARSRRGPPPPRRR